VSSNRRDKVCREIYILLTHCCDSAVLRLEQPCSQSVVVCASDGNGGQGRLCQELSGNQLVCEGINYTADTATRVLHLIALIAKSSRSNELARTIRRYRIWSEGTPVLVAPRQPLWGGAPKLLD
jgi:hypothetical protein